jgi:hypothetical protein
MTVYFFGARTEGDVACLLCPNATIFSWIFLVVAGHVNVAPRHLTAEAETLLLATLIHEVHME